MRRAARRTLQRAPRAGQDEDQEAVVLGLLLRHGYPCSRQGLRGLYGVGRRMSYQTWLGCLERHLGASANATLPDDLTAQLIQHTARTLQGPADVESPEVRRRWAERWEKFFFAQLVRVLLDEMALRGMTPQQAVMLSQHMWSFLDWARAMAQGCTTPFRPGELPIQYACRMLGTALSAFRAEKPQQLPRRDHPLRQWLWRHHHCDLPDFRVEPNRTPAGRGIPTTLPKWEAARVDPTPIARAATAEQLVLL